MTDYQPGAVVPREDLQEGWRVRVEHEGVVGSDEWVHVQTHHDLKMAIPTAYASRIVLLEAPDPDAAIIEALAETRHRVTYGGDGALWERESKNIIEAYRRASRAQLALLREKGILQ